MLGVLGVLGMLLWVRGGVRGVMRVLRVSMLRVGVTPPVVHHGAKGIMLVRVGGMGVGVREGLGPPSTSTGPCSRQHSLVLCLLLFL